MDSTTSENTSGQPATQEQKIATALPFIFERVKRTFELFNFHPLNLETIASEIFHSPGEIEFRATKDFLDSLVDTGQLHTFKENLFRNFWEIQVALDFQTEFKFSDFNAEHQVWKLTKR